MSAPAAAPVGALTLKPLSVHGLCDAVMTTPGRRAALHDLVGAHLRRDAPCGDRDGDVARQEDLGRGRGEVLRGEAAVVGDDDALRLLAAVLDVARDAVRAAAHVLEGVVVGDPRPPAVGAEHDLVGVGASARLVTDVPPLLHTGSRSSCTSGRASRAPRRRAMGSGR